MSQPVTSSRLTNSAVNIIGATTAVNTNFGLARIGVTGNSFDISSSSGTVTLGITGTGNVQIGNATSGTVTLPGVTTFASLNGATTTSDINIGSNLIAGGTVVLGSTASTTNLFGVLDVTNIEGPTAGSALTIGNNIGSGSISIGNAGGPNTITIGSNGAGPTGTVNVGVSSRVINVGTSQPGTINVGVAGSTAFIGGTVLLGATGSGDVVIGPNTGSVTNIGNNNAAATTVNLGNTGSAAFGSVNVGRGAATINIGGNVASAITLGKTGGSVTLGPALTLGAAPTTSGHLGYLIAGTVVTTMPTNGSSIASLTLTVPGIYLVYFNIKIANIGNVLYFNLNNQNAGASFGYSPIATTECNVSGVFNLTITTNTTTNLIVSFNGAPTISSSSSFFSALRIA